MNLICRHFGISLTDLIHQELAPFSMSKEPASAFCSAELAELLFPILKTWEVDTPKNGPFEQAVRLREKLYILLCAKESAMDTDFPKDSLGIQEELPAMGQDFQKKEARAERDANTEENFRTFDQPKAGSTAYASSSASSAFHTAPSRSSEESSKPGQKPPFQSGKPKDQLDRDRYVSGSRIEPSDASCSSIQQSNLSRSNIRYIDQAEDVDLKSAVLSEAFPSRKTDPSGQMKPAKAASADCSQNDAPKTMAIDQVQQEDMSAAPASLTKMKGMETAPEMTDPGSKEKLMESFQRNSAISSADFGFYNNPDESRRSIDTAHSFAFKNSIAPKEVLSMHNGSSVPLIQMPMHSPAIPMPQKKAEEALSSVDLNQLWEQLSALYMQAIDEKISAAYAAANLLGVIVLQGMLEYADMMLPESVEASTPVKTMIKAQLPKNGELHQARKELMDQDREEQIHQLIALAGKDTASASLAEYLRALASCLHLIGSINEPEENASYGAWLLQSLASSGNSYASNALGLLRQIKVPKQSNPS